jgi:hypothetical protein
MQNFKINQIHHTNYIGTNIMREIYNDVNTWFCVEFALYS